MLLAIPNELVRNIVMKIDCIDHLEKVYICNKEFHKVLKQYWFFNHLLTVQKKTLNFQNKQLDRLGLIWSVYYMKIVIQKTKVVLVVIVNNF